MTYQQLLRQRNFILLDCISGSKAYNLDIPGSDTDRKGVFILPKNEFYGLNGIEQLSNETNDEVYFEIRRFIELLIKNNPNILELLSTPEKFILFKHPLLDLVKTEDFLSKLCFETFAGYAKTQLKKARGLNKKINKAIDPKRKSILDFCYVIYENGSLPLKKWLTGKGWRQEDCGLLNLPHFRDVYLLFHRSQFSEGHFRGVTSGEDANEVLLSPIPKGIDSIATLNFNKDGYSVYCKEYKEYREWEEKRNIDRFEATLAHGKNYDAKNMMHTFRLLNMAEEIAMEKEINVYRNDREFLLKIRNGEFKFDDLMSMIEEKMHRIEELFERCDLPEFPDQATAENTLIYIREKFYTIVQN